MGSMHHGRAHGVATQGVDMDSGVSIHTTAIRQAAMQRAPVRLAASVQVPGARHARGHGRRVRMAAALALLAGTAALSGCITTDYGYRGGPGVGTGDYYYATPSLYDDGWYGSASYGIGYGSGWYDGWYGGIGWPSYVWGGWGWPYAGYGYGPGWWDSGWGWGWPGYYPPVVIVRPPPPPPPPNNHRPPSGTLIGNAPIYGNHGELLPPPSGLLRPVQGAPSRSNTHLQRLEQRNVFDASSGQVQGQVESPRWNHAPPPLLSPPPREARIERIEGIERAPPPRPRIERTERVERMPALPRMESAPASSERYRDRNREH
jgi:hypothetical protein